jgi:glycosyltransferase involved in cell wall biosynthesis
MTQPVLYIDKFEQDRVCVIVPTYNNAKSLGAVINDISAYTKNIIAVNDGSFDETEKILDEFPFLNIISYKKNVGKGWALRQGLKRATDLGYLYAITIDSDGQHFAKDLPKFIDKLEAEKNAIIIGARNMDQESVPGKSSFGHKFSNFWFKVETGITAPDTQSGYRLYPLQSLSKIKFLTRKYEFEIEVLVRAAWNGVKIESVPVSVYYAPKEIRVSHFRPFKDFTRISILNTVLVFITFLYIKPGNFFRSIFKKETWYSIWYDHLLHPGEPDIIKATSVAFGVFMGIVPIWGFQLVVAIFLAILFKLNKPIVIIAANISIPPMIPVIIFLSFMMGSFWIGDKAIDFSLTNNITLDSIKQNVQQYIYGSITLAIVAGIAFGLLTLALLKIFKKKHTPAV